MRHLIECCSRLVMGIKVRNYLETSKSSSRRKKSKESMDMGYKLAEEAKLRGKLLPFSAWGFPCRTFPSPRKGKRRAPKRLLACRWRQGISFGSPFLPISIGLQPSRAADAHWTPQVPRTGCHLSCDSMAQSSGKSSPSGRWDEECGGGRGSEDICGPFDIPPKNAPVECLRRWRVCFLILEPWGCWTSRVLCG